MMPETTPSGEPLTALDLWRRHPAALASFFLSNLGLFVSVFIAGVTTPWVFGLTAAFWLASRAARSRVIPADEDPTTWRRAVVIVSAICVGGAFMLALAVSPWLAPLFA